MLLAKYEYKPAIKFVSGVFNVYDRQINCGSYSVDSSDGNYRQMQLVKSQVSLHIHAYSL
jgi:hypothetical protein